MSLTFVERNIENNKVKYLSLKEKEIANFIDKYLSIHFEQSWDGEKHELESVYLCLCGEEIDRAFTS